MSYLQLKCVDCDQVLPSVIATESGELLCPPAEICPTCGQDITGNENKLNGYVRQFHRDHKGHRLIEEETDHAHAA